MPIYEYKCKKCGKVFSKLVFNTEAPVECPECSSQDVEKLISKIGSVSNSGGGGGCCSGGSSGFT